MKERGDRISVGGKENDAKRRHEEARQKRLAGFNFCEKPIFIVLNFIVQFLRMCVIMHIIQCTIVPILWV